MLCYILSLVEHVFDLNVLYINLSLFCLPWQSATLPFPTPGYVESSLFQQLQPQTHHTLSAENLQRPISNQLPPYHADLSAVHRNESSSSSERGQVGKDNDSEEDHEVTSPSRKMEKPITSPRPSLDHKKKEILHQSSNSSVSYENESVIQEMRAAGYAQGETNQRKIPVPQPRSRPEYEQNQSFQPDSSSNLASLTQEKDVVESKLPVEFESPRSQSPADYENTTMAPLPTYEEAVSGDMEDMPLEAEFFNMDDLEAPPAPPRSDSQNAILIDTVEKVDVQPVELAPESEEVKILTDLC